MKKTFVSLTVFVLFALTVFGQAPQSMKYQTVVRNSSGQIIANQQVIITLSIVQGSPNGAVICTETFTPTTNEYGLVNIEIGSLNPSAFSSIDWSSGPYFTKVELNGILMGTSQLLSVPYALYSKTSGSILTTDPYSVITYGADGTNNPSMATTNVSAFQQAIDFAYSMGGGTIRIPSGKYWINNTITLRNSVSIVGESLESTLILVSGVNTGFAAFLGGSDAASWGSFGYLKIEDLTIKGNWDGVTQGTGVGIKLMHSAHIQLNRVGIEYFSGVNLHFKASGYSSVEQCRFNAAGYDCIWFESYSDLDACTSTSIRNSQISTSLRSSIHINNGFNLVIDGCQMENSHTALLVGGSSNRSVVFIHNYIEQTTGDYDISLGDATGYGFSIHDNFLVGTPDITTFQFPPLIAGVYIYVWNNIAETPCRSDVRSLDCP
jgi:hypothetical protein